MSHLHKEDLDRVNSMTKYPSIPTYHELDPQNGNLLENPVQFFGEVIATEKVDGTNARLICFPETGNEDGGFFIGSREELLHAAGDILWNPMLGIVEAIEDWAYDLELQKMIDKPTVLFLEVFGGTIGKQAKQYTSAKEFDFRIFDIMEIEVNDYDDMMRWPLERISSWREHGGQHFLPEDQLVGRITGGGLKASLVPRLFRIDARALPHEVQETAVWLKDNLETTNVAIDERAGGSPEGIVLRSADRKIIAKARFEDYNRTLRRRQELLLKEQNRTRT